MSMYSSGPTGKRTLYRGGLLSSLLVASGIALLILSSALFLGQGPAAGSDEPLLGSSGALPEADVTVLLAANGPAFDTADSRLVLIERPAASPAVAAQPPLMLAAQPAAEPVVAPLIAPSPPAPAVVPVLPAPTSTPVPPPPTEQPAPPPPPAQPATLSTFEANILTGVNDERVAAGLAALQLDSALVGVARERSEDMVKQGYFGHVSPSGETAFSLLDRYAIPYGWAGENLARNNYPDDEAVAVSMRDWMASLGHRENILNVHYTAIGVGAAVDSSGMKYFTLVFTGP